ncbi:MAG TPA: VOC family protein [Mycobacteriales bacterium]
MAIHRLNHAVLYVQDVARSADFYCGVLGFTPIEGSVTSRGAAFLRAPGSTNDHDLGLFEVGDEVPAAGRRPSVGLYHLAWEVDTLTDLRSLARALAEAGSLIGSSDHSTTKSLYGRDPDGLEFEICWIVPADQIDDDMLANRTYIRPLDLDREMSRFGADTPGGLGVSRPLGAGW